MPKAKVVPNFPPCEQCKQPMALEVSCKEYKIAGMALTKCYSRRLCAACFFFKLMSFSVGERYWQNATTAVKKV